MAKAKRRVKAKRWGDGLVFQKTRRRPDGTRYVEDRWWIQFSVDGDVRREPTDARSEEQAQAILDRKVHAVREGIPVPVGRGVRLSDVRKRYVQHYEDKERRSIKTALGRWKNLLDLLGGDVKVSSLTADRLAQYGRERVKEGASPSTVNREWAALHRGLVLCQKARVLAAIPTFPERLPEPRPRQGFVTAEQRAAIRAHLEPVYQDALDFAMLTGWRKQQILSLEWTDVHGDEIRVSGDKTKTGAAHVLPISGDVREILARREKARQLGCPWIFHRAGERIRNFRKAWASATKAAGCPELLFHDTRRSAVRNLVHAGVGQATAMAISGHKTVDVFRRYSIVTNADVARALEAVSAAPVATAPKKVAPKKHHQRVVALAGRRKYV
jgi:integrase